MENLLKRSETLREKALDTRRLLDIDGQKDKIRELKREASRPDFWNDREKAVKIGKKMEEMEKEVAVWEDFLGEITELEELAALAEKEGDSSFDEEARVKYDELEKKYAQLEFRILFSGKYDSNNAIVSVHAGTGGVDAQDWAEMLERMILRYAEKNSWKTEMIDRTAGGEAGIKSSVIGVKGRWAYGNLKSESGVHRLVRISPFDAEAMRHTSFALIEVIPEMPETEELEIKDEDLKIDTYRSSGAGGQHVNKTESAIRITHVPTGLVAACQSQRSQHQNKETAMKILKSKLYKLEEEKREKEEKKIKGEVQKAEWGKQIRSYVLQPYRLVKDHRTNHETQDVDAVLDGGLEGFAEAYLRYLRG